MSNKCIAVLTVESTRRVLRQGGSRAWKLDANRARKCGYLICVQNQNNSARDFSDTSEAHGAVFLVGKISDVIPDPQNPSSGRWQICISEYSIHTVMDAWKGWQNPVRYSTLEEMGIDLEALVFRSVSDGQHDLQLTTGQQVPAAAPKKQDDGSVIPLSIASAKAGLAAYYAVSQEAIEIVIRG
ncbi:MAG: hypothetical protein M3Y39_07270 [Chloroflexota bacterium]|nr:hypothetical protein [Chloroflexota bacterium]